MDVAGNPRPLLGDRPAELRLADRPPDADEQDAEGEEPKQVARKDVVARTDRREHVVEVGEDDERQGQRQPAVEVAAVAAVAQSEPDRGNEREHGEQA